MLHLHQNIKAAAHISRSLTRQRIAVLRFDFTGLGDSEGDFAETNFTSNVSTCSRSLATWSRNRSAQAADWPFAGGSAALQAAHYLPSVAGVVTIVAPFETSHLSRLLADTKAIAEIEGEARVTIGGTTFRLKKQFFDDLERNHMQHAIATLNRSLLVMHSPADKTIPIENGLEIFAADSTPRVLFVWKMPRRAVRATGLVGCGRGYCGRASRWLRQPET